MQNPVTGGLNMISPWRGLLAGMLAVLIAGAATGQTSYDFNTADGGWTGTGNWTWSASGWSTAGWAGDETWQPKTYYLTSPVLSVSANGTIAGSFVHRFNFELGGATTSYDGGQFQYSVNGGAWTTVQQGLLTGQTYNVTVEPSGAGSSYDASIAGQQAFGQQSSGFGTGGVVTSSFTLGAGSAITFNAGDQVQIRFLGAWDFGTVALPAPNWQITDVTINGVTAIPEPSTYAAILGVVALIGVAVRRRNRGT